MNDDGGGYKGGDVADWTTNSARRATVPVLRRGGGARGRKVKTASPGMGGVRAIGLEPVLV